MHPVLVELGLPGGGSFSVHTLGVCIALGVLLGWRRVTRTDEALFAGRVYALGLVFAALLLLAGRLAGGAGVYGGLLALAATYVRFAPKGSRSNFAEAFVACWSLLFVGVFFDGFAFGAPWPSGPSWLAAPSTSLITDWHHRQGLIDAASTHSLPTYPLAFLLALAGPLMLVVSRPLPIDRLSFVVGALGAILLIVEPLRHDPHVGPFSLSVGLLLVAIGVASGWILRPVKTASP